MDEESVQQDLTKWIDERMRGEIYWSESPPEGIQKFTFEGLRGRPDLLIDGEESILLEIKDGNDSKNIYDAASQLHEYWRQYEFENAKVHINGTEVKVDQFLIATQYSPEGHLFKQEREKGYRKVYDSEEFWNKGSRPKYEWARTEAIPRMQWRYAWSESEDRYEVDRNNIETGVGVLLSDRLDSNPEGDNQSGLGEFYNEDPSPTSLPCSLYYVGGESIWEQL